MDALLKELHGANVAAGDRGPQVEQAEAGEAEGARQAEAEVEGAQVKVQTAGLPRPALGVEVHVAHWPLRDTSYKYLS